MKRIVPVIALLGLVLIAGGCAQPPAATTPEPTATGEPTATSQVDIIDLPNGFQPEGIAAQGDMIYVGSIPTGAIYSASVQSGEGTVAISPPSGRAAVGIKLDDRGQLFVAGGPTGSAFVYDLASGADLATYKFTETTSTFVNDVALTADAAWFTDSQKAVLYKVDLPATGQVTGDEKVATLQLTGEFKLQEGAFNLNGIVPAGDRLIVVQSGKGLLFAVNPQNGETEEIDVSGADVKNGDGLLLDGQTLYVVQNQANEIAVIELGEGFTAGTLVTRITNPAFDVPTTIALLGDSLYLPNARFSTTPSADTTYTVVRVDKQ